jgi:2-polyprenyl-6-methoxyphenol hydroxylase-like FAD-dependent oxidoreductase
MGGLFAARVLSETFARVTVIERDALETDTEKRRGVPQGRHVHGFQARGVQILDDLFPGLLDGLTDAGASKLDDLSQLHFSINGHPLSSRPQPISPLVLATRPHLERWVRDRVSALEPVVIRDRTEVLGLLHTRGIDDQAIVTGVRIVPTGGGSVTELAADLVVDTTGRGSRTPLWLTELGYERPTEDRIAVRVKYASQLLRLRRRPPKRFCIEGRTPSTKFGIALFGCEDDTWLFTVMGTEAAFPTTPTREWMVLTAAAHVPAWAAEAVATAEPISPVSTYNHQASVRRRYDRLTRFPTRLVVLGDAMCAFNPIYGQGMSVAAEEAVLLGATLRAGTDRVAERFFRAAGTPISTAWDLAAGSDLAFPEVEGNPTRAMRVINRYVDRVLTAAETDPEVARRFMAVSGLIAPRTGIFAPRMVGAVLRTLGRRPMREQTVATEPTIPATVA